MKIALTVAEKETLIFLVHFRKEIFLKEYDSESIPDKSLLKFLEDLEDKLVSLK